ncbi:MAG: prepilin peptidase [Deltaproteobacteria bacterium]|nr:prepilin peptidase [Deltaproteobacteria bacterium]
MGRTDIMALFSLLFGLILGSFLNVCIHRIPRKESIINPPSSCPQCGERIRYYDNIPLISYGLLLGKCRTCRNPIPLSYPIVELITGVLSTALFIRYGLSLQYFLFLSFSASLVVVCFIDLHHKIIPDTISLPGILFGLAISSFKLIDISWSASLIGIIGGGGFFYLVGIIFEWLRGKEGMGGGDVKLLAMIGAWMGWKSLPYIILISSFTGALIGGVSLLLAGRKFSEKIPYGPFLVLGTLAYLFFENELKYLWGKYLILG